MRLTATVPYSGGCGAAVATLLKTAIGERTLNGLITREPIRRFEKEPKEFLMKVPFPITFFGVLCILALSAGVTSAATGSTDASPAAALRGPVTIECDGVLPPVAPWGRPAKGRCLITGAIIDAGRFADDHRPLITPHIRTILGSEGTLRISVYREHGNWRIIEGTRAYAGLGGRGWERTQRTGPSGGACPRPQGIACMVSLTMKGTVVP